MVKVDFLTCRRHFILVGELGDISKQVEVCDGIGEEGTEVKTAAQRLVAAVTMDVAERLSDVGIDVKTLSSQEEARELVGEDAEYAKRKLGWSTPYGKHKPYKNSLLTGAQKDEIANEIVHKRYTNYGTDVLTLDVDGNRYIYLIDHSPNDVYFENIKNGEGYGVRTRFAISKINADGIRTIIRNIAGEYGYSATRIRKVLQDYGVRPGNLSSVNLDAELKRIIDSNVDVYGEDRRTWHKEGYRGKQYYDDSESGGTVETGLDEEARGDGGIEFSTSDAIIYGWQEGDTITLTPEGINPNTPVHEYTHLWSKAVQKNKGQRKRRTEKELYKWKK